MIFVDASSSICYCNTCFIAYIRSVEIGEHEKQLKNNHTLQGLRTFHQCVVWRGLNNHKDLGGGGGGSLPLILMHTCALMTYLPCRNIIRYGIFQNKHKCLYFETSYQQL